LITPGLRWGISLCRLVLARKVVKEVKVYFGCSRDVWIYTNKMSDVLLGMFATLRMATVMGCSGQPATDTKGYRRHHFGQHNEVYKIYPTTLQQSTITQTLV
jgi:hypothetical protein